MQEKNLYLMKFSKNIRKLRTERNLTQIDVATAIGVTRSLYQRYESITNVPDIGITKIIKIAKFFEVNIDELIK